MNLEDPTIVQIVENLLCEDCSETPMTDSFLNSFQACNNYKLFEGKTAEADLKSLQDALNHAPIENDLVNHNMVVFRNGEGALQVWQPV